MTPCILLQLFLPLSILSDTQTDLSKAETLKCGNLLIFGRVIFSSFSDPQGGAPSLVGCPRLLIKYI
jgi:hypothetical protein